LSIPTFRKPRWAFSAIAVALLVHQLGGYGLGRVADWAETQADAYPFQAESWLRYLLPSLFSGRGTGRIMIVGSSDAREGLLYEYFDEAFPERRTFQAATSLGNLDDIRLAMEYVERVYGEEALPDVAIIGIGTQTASNFPESRPLELAINRYSPYLRIENTPEGRELVDKTRWEEWKARWAFSAAKSPARFRTGLTAWLGHVAFGTDRPAPVEASNWKERMARTIESSIGPYQVHGDWPVLDDDALLEVMADSTTRWPSLHAWDPESSAATIERTLGRLMDQFDRHGTEIFIVILPERSTSRVMYGPGFYERYVSIIRGAATDNPVLDLHDFLPDSLFVDATHPNRVGAVRMTGKVIEFISGNESSEAGLDEGK
jgi:hypothetical protein